MGFSRQEYWSGVPLPSPLRCYISIQIYTHSIWIVIFHNANYLKKLKLVQVSELCFFFFSQKKTCRKQWHLNSNSSLLALWIEYRLNLQISVFSFVKLESSSHTLWCDTSTLLLFFISSETQVSATKWFPFSPLCFFN